MQVGSRNLRTAIVFDGNVERRRLACSSEYDYERGSAQAAIWVIFTKILLILLHYSLSKSAFLCLVLIDLCDAKLRECLMYLLCLYFGGESC